MTSQTVARLGVQAPRVAVTPPGITSTAGQEAAELAEQCGLVLDTWQRSIVDVALGELADGSLAAQTVKIIASRQNGKNVGLEVVQLHDIVLAGVWWIHTAHHGVTMRESFNRLFSLVQSSREIKDRLTLKYSSPMSGYEMQFKGGGRIRFIARTRTSGRGLSGDKLAVDEDQDATDDALGALLPTISANSNSGSSQAWYLGSAPGPTALVSHRFRLRGRNHVATDDRFAYFEFSADPKAELDDRDAWAQANPRLGRGLTEAFVESERQSMSDEMFARERLSISPDIDDGTSRVFAPGVWQAVNADKVAQPEHGLVLAVDVNPERTRAAIAVGSAGGAVGLVDERQGVGWVVDEAVRLAGVMGAPVAVAGASPAGSLVADLERAGVTVVAMSQGDVRAACGWFFDAVVDRKVVVQRHPALDVAVSAAVKKQSGDAFVWDRRAGDVCALVAVTLAAWASQCVTPEVDMAGQVW
jgi:hypothetical protein